MDEIRADLQAWGLLRPRNNEWEEAKKEFWAVTGFCALGTTAFIMVGFGFLLTNLMIT